MAGQLPPYFLVAPQQGLSRLVATDGRQTALVQAEIKKQLPEADIENAGLGRIEAKLVEVTGYLADPMVSTLCQEDSRLFLELRSHRCTFGRPTGAGQALSIGKKTEGGPSCTGQMGIGRPTSCYL